jgi:hypothetical protein
MQLGQGAASRSRGPVENLPGYDNVYGEQKANSIFAICSPYSLYVRAAVVSFLLPPDAAGDFALRIADVAEPAKIKASISID